ncbi:ACO1_3 [Sanghuangporus vaninii]
MKNQLTSEYGGIPQTAAYYRDRGIKWVEIGDSNYGKGSSREHAALESRYLGGLTIIVNAGGRSDDDREAGDLRVWQELGYGDGTLGRVGEIGFVYSFIEGQIEWFKAGSALNLERVLKLPLVSIMLTEHCLADSEAGKGQFN